jgi:hypothetical protein
MVFPAEIKGWIVGPSASCSIVTRLAKEPTRESMEDYFWQSDGVMQRGIPQEPQELLHQ